MNRIFSATCLAALALLFTSACNTDTAQPASTVQTPRIAEHKADFDALPPATRRELAAGLINRGQSMKLVYIALGRPDRITSSPDAKTVTWTYRNYLPPAPQGKPAPQPQNASPSPAMNSPLSDTFEAWNNGVMKHSVESDPTTVAKASGQSWTEYGKYRKDRDMAANESAVAMLDQQARANYLEAQKSSPLTDPGRVKLDVVFVDQLVSDAIIDDSVSAFAPAGAGR